MSSKFLFPRSNPEPQMSFQQFLTVPIGKGSYGTVFRGIHKRTFQKYAIKQIFKKNHQRFIHYQLQIMYSIDCGNVVRLYDHFETQTSVCLLMEYVEGRQLFDGIINKKIKLNYQEVAKIIFELCTALKYIHDLKIIHRDVKPENIMLTKEGKLKLADFGAANYLVENESRKTFIGTPQYMAPQLLYENQQSAAVDIWAVGVILYELTAMKLPFTAKTTAKIYQNIKNIKYEFPVSLQRDYQLKQLIKSILVANPKERPSAQQVIDHSWIQKYLKQTNTAHVKSIQQSSGVEDKQEINLNLMKQPAVNEITQKIQSKIQSNLKQVKQSSVEIKQKQQQKSIQQQKYRLELQKKISLIQAKIGVSKKLKEKKQKIIETNKIHMQQLEREIDNHFQFKEQLQAIQNQIKSGDTRYFAALQQRTKLKAHQFKLKQQNKYKLLKRKNSGSGSDKKTEKTEKRKDIVTTSTISSNRVLSQEKDRNQSYLKSHLPLQKSLSFSILQIETLLSQIREKKQRISGTGSSPNIRL